MNVNFRETDHLKTQISNNDIRHKELEEQIDEKEETINKYVCVYSRLSLSRIPREFQGTL